MKIILFGHRGCFGTEFRKIASKNKKMGVPYSSFILMLARCFTALLSMNYNPMKNHDSFIKDCSVAVWTFHDILFQ